MKGRRLGAASAGLFAATMVANLCAVAYHRVLSDRLGLAAYAQLYALIAVVSVLSNLTLGLNTWLVKAFSADAEAGGPGAVKGRLAALARPGLLSLAAATALLLALAPLAAGYLNLPGLAPALTVAVIVTLGVALLTLRSSQQGLHHFGWLGLSVGSEGLARVAGAVFLGLGVEGGLLAFVLGQAVGCVCAAGGLLGLGPASEPHPYGGVKGGLAEGGSDTLALTLFALLCYLDVVVLKHHYSDERAGLYSRAALVAKSFLYLPSALSMVLLAAAARERAGGRDARGLLARFLGAALALDALGLAVVWFGTPFCLGLLAGPNPAFRTAAMLTLTRCFSLAVVPLGLLQLVVVYLLAVRGRGVVPGLAALALAYLALLRSFWDSELAVVTCLGACSLVGLAGALWMAWGTRPPRPSKRAPAA